MARLRASIIIPLYNQAGFTRVCLEYVIRNTPMDGVEVILVDNASSDSTQDLLKAVAGPVKKIRNDVNLGFAKACNQGARASEGAVLVFLNNDTAPHRGWLEGLLEPLRNRPDVAAVGPKLVYPDMTIQQAGVVYSEVGLPYHLYTGCAGDLPGANKARFFRSLTGACLAVNRDDFFAAGGFDEIYLNGLEDIELCLKLDQARKGIYYNPASVVTHFESRSENRQARMEDNAKIFVSRWGSDNSRWDDHKYLSQDGMAIWIGSGNRIEFRPLEEVRSLLQVDYARAEALMRTEAAPAMALYRDMLARAPFNIDVLRRVQATAEKMGAMEVANTFRRKVEILAADAGEAYGREIVPGLAARQTVAAGVQGR